MPLYVYKCERCGSTFEEIQKQSDPPPTYECPQGGSCELNKQLTSGSFKFRAGATEGGGWERQGEAMVRRIRGPNTTKYGEGSV